MFWLQILLIMLLLNACMTSGLNNLVRIKLRDICIQNITLWLKALLLNCIIGSNFLFPTSNPIQYLRVPHVAYPWGHSLQGIVANLDNT
uniref:Protein NAR1 n=1 Tax=Rhizophora mucronata TaxID=61149 RepID=A0A2P2L5Y6_RHIMU